MILKKLEDGHTYRQLALEYQISTSTIQSWRKNIDGVERQFTPTKIDNKTLIADVELHPDDFHYERARRFNCSDRGISKALKRLGITQKKTLNHPKADAELRCLYLKQLHQFEKENRPIVFLDESGFKSHDHRPHGYSNKGRKCFGEYNWQLKNQTNAIGATYEPSIICCWTLRL